MNILEFSERFPNEQSCKTHLKQLREKQGITCKKCGCVTKHWWLNSIEKFQCSECDSRTNLRCGTLMEKSKVPIKKWFMCIHLMTATKKPFSCLELQRQLGIKYYVTCQELINKIRLNMGKRESKYQLKGEIEMDEAFFEVVDLPQQKDELGNVISTDNSVVTIDNKQKRGRGSQGKQSVLVMVESRARPQSKKFKKNREMGFVKMIVVDRVNSVTVTYEVAKNIDKDAHIISDAWKGFVDVKTIVAQHTAGVVPSKSAMKKLPWVHTVISNCKRELLGTHHSVTRDYLQTYLDEFCYKINRRGFETDLFDRMLVSIL